MRVVFIHGAFSRDGAWWWAPTAALLEGSGIASAAVALPSCGEAGVAPTGDGPGLHEDAAAATAVLDEGGPAILVAHSYGGMVASQAGEHPAVRHLVYISSFLPAVGEKLATISSGPDPVPVIPHADGSVSVDDRDRVAFDARFLHDVGDPDLVNGAHDRLCAQSSVVFGAQTTKAAWQRVPSTYLVCAEERSTDPTFSAPKPPGRPPAASWPPDTSQCSRAPTSSPHASTRSPPPPADASSPIDGGRERRPREGGRHDDGAEPRSADRALIHGRRAGHHRLRAVRRLGHDHLRRDIGVMGSPGSTRRWPTSSRG